MLFHATGTPLLTTVWGGDVKCLMKVQTEDTMWKVRSVHMKSMQAKTKSEWWFMFIHIQRSGSGLITVKWRMLICPSLPGWVSIQSTSEISPGAYRYVRCWYFWTLSMHRAEQIEWLSRCLKIKTSQYLPGYCASQTLDCSLCTSIFKGLIMEIWLMLSCSKRLIYILFLLVPSILFHLLSFLGVCSTYLWN